MADRKTAVERDLRLRSLNHFNVPVRDLNVAHKFYCDILGGVVIQEYDWERHQTGRAFGAHADIQMFDGAGCLITYWQPWGQPAPDQAVPHRSFRVRSPEQLDALRARLDRVGVPTILVADRVGPEGSAVPVSLCFRDPDGNQLALVAEDFVMDDRPLPANRYDPWPCTTAIETGRPRSSSPLQREEVKAIITADGPGGGPWGRSSPPTHSTAASAKPCTGR